MRVLLMTMLFLAACAGASDAPAASGANPYAGTSWTRAGEAGGEALVQSIRFEAERASGSAGCNRWFAAFSVEGAAMRFGPAGATRMACLPAVMAAERAMLGALGAVAAARVEADDLVLLDAAGGELLRFARAEPEPR